MAVAVASLPTPAPTPPPTKQQELKKRKQPQPPYLPNRHDYHPTHPSLFRIEFGPEGEEFGSCLRAERVRLSLAPGAIERFEGVRVSCTRLIAELLNGRS